MRQERCIDGLPAGANAESCNPGGGHVFNRRKLVQRNQHAGGVDAVVAAVGHVAAAAHGEGQAQRDDVRQTVAQLLGRGRREDAGRIEDRRVAPQHLLRALVGVRIGRQRRERWKGFLEGGAGS